MYRGRRVDGKGYVYIRVFRPKMETDSKPKVKVLREYDFDYRDEDVSKLSTFYIVDPGQNIVF